MYERNMYVVAAFACCQAPRNAFEIRIHQSKHRRQFWHFFLLTFDLLLDSNDLVNFLDHFSPKIIDRYIYILYLFSRLQFTEHHLSILNFANQLRNSEANTHTYTLTHSVKHTLLYTHTRTLASIHITIVKTINNVLEESVFL